MPHYHPQQERNFSTPEERAKQDWIQDIVAARLREKLKFDTYKYKANQQRLLFKICPWQLFIRSLAMPVGDVRIMRVCHCAGFHNGYF